MWSKNEKWVIDKKMEETRELRRSTANGLVLTKSPPSPKAHPEEPSQIAAGTSHSRHTAVLGPRSTPPNANALMHPSPSSLSSCRRELQRILPFAVPRLLLHSLTRQPGRLRTRLCAIR